MTPNFAFTRPNRRNVLRMIGGGVATSAAAGLAMPAIAQQRSINIISEQTNVNAREALAAICRSFEEDTGITVTLNNMDHEAHKTAIRNYLVAGPPDVCFWFSGERMRAFVNHGLFEDITDLFERENYYDVLGGTVGSVTVEGRQYGLPTGGTLWGMYYRTDVFEEQGFSVPESFEDLLSLGQSARAAGLTPVAFGSRQLWPAAGWFDHMNLRINGLDFHMALMDGEVSYTDDALTEVFDRWEELIQAGIFLDDHSSYGWQEAGALIAQKQAAMMNLGNFLRAVMPEGEDHLLQFAPFPIIDPSIGRYENFSVNSVHIPANAQNKDLGREFLAHFYRPENLDAFLSPTGAIPPRSDIPGGDDHLRNQAIENLRTVDGTAQYYDRDTDPDMAQVGLNAFQEFMVRPERRQDIQERLESNRRRIFSV